MEKASEYNKDVISDGRLEVKQGDVSVLDLSDNTFELAMLRALSLRRS